MKRNGNQHVRLDEIGSPAEDADDASADREVSAAHMRIAALGLTFVSRQLYEVVVDDVGARGRSG